MGLKIMDLIKLINGHPNTCEMIYTLNIRFLMHYLKYVFIYFYLITHYINQICYIFLSLHKIFNKDVKN